MNLIIDYARQQRESFGIDHFISRRILGSVDGENLSILD
jgi:hypothetical protein